MPHLYNSTNVLPYHLVGSMLTLSNWGFRECHKSSYHSHLVQLFRLPVFGCGRQTRRAQPTLYDRRYLDLIPQCCGLSLIKTGKRNGIPESGSSSLLRKTIRQPFPGVSSTVYAIRSLISTSLSEQAGFAKVPKEIEGVLSVQSGK